MALPLHLRKKIADHDPDVDGRTISQFCRDEGISRESYRNIKRRIADKGTAGVYPDSTAPKHPARRFDDAVRQAIVDARTQLKEQGLDYGPWSIYYHLCDDPAICDPAPSRATIASVLAAAGLAVTNPRKRPRSSYQRFARSQANELWQIDGVHYRLFDTHATHVTIYQIIDDATRFDVGTCAFTAAERSEDVCQALRAAFDAYGKPQQILSDNGDAFAGYHKGFVSATERFLADNGILMIAGFHPTTQGKDERSHQTLRKFLDARQPATTDQLDKAITEFRQVYNTQRRHQALVVGKMHITPHTAWTTWPTAPSPTTPIDHTQLWERAMHYRSPQRRLPELHNPPQPQPQPTNDDPLQQIRDHWHLTEYMFVAHNGQISIGGQRIYIGSRFKNRRLITKLVTHTPQHHAEQADDLPTDLPEATTHIIELYSTPDGELLCTIPIPPTYDPTAPTKGAVNINNILGAWHRHPPKIYKRAQTKRLQKQNTTPAQ